jgi:PIN domain nuclease of toxin-antitoxin system
LTGEHALLLDTHIALWLDSGSERLTVSTRKLIENCWQDGGTVCLSAVSVWEIAMLAHAGRIELNLPVERWVSDFLTTPGMRSVPLVHRAAARCYQLRHLEHRDPADRLLIATAIELACPLVTYDDRILRFARNYGRQYGFATSA